MSAAPSNQPAPAGREVRLFRFGTFEVDLEQRELRNRGVRVPLQQKPFCVLELLLRKSGTLVTRQELAQYLWPNLHVSFDRGLNTAINVLRRALGESHKDSAYIETRAGLGYRFIAPVQAIYAGATSGYAHQAIESVAVLPFESEQAIPELGLLAGEITDSVTAQLSKIRELRIISQTTKFHFSGNFQEFDSTAAKSNAQAVLTGRVLQRGDSLLISAALVETRSDRRLWGADYETERSGILAAGRNLCLGVADALGVRAEVLEIFQNDQDSFEAHEHYAKGRYFYKRMTEEDLRKSIAFFEAALAHNPQYAPAFTGLADTYTLLALLGVLKPATARARAMDLVLTAIEIQPDLAEAHASLAGIKKLFDWDWSGAEAEYLRAVELNPNYADAHRWYSALLCSLGRIEDANREMRAAQRLDPVSLAISSDCAWNHFMARDFQCAVEQAWKTLVMDAKYAPAQHTLGMAYEHLGMDQEAITELQNARICSGEHPVTIASLAHAYGALGMRDRALQTVNELHEILQRRYVPPYCMSIAYAGLDDHDAAFAWLDKAVEERDVWLLWLRQDPRFDPLRATNRFSRLIRNLRLSADAATHQTGG